MDITPIYDLRARLKAGAIAGTGLIPEDFRLKRAVEAIRPLAGASPVFTKLVGLAESVLAPECPDREGALLDALTLADAVLCTQGKVTADGPLEAVHTTGCGSLAMDVPYSTMAALLDALANSGSGRYSLVLETHEQRPELFEDYRVKAALVGALGASYGELADQAKEWLKESGEAVLPLLYSGFDPRGKKEMVRRVQIVEAVAGKNANPFYLEQLDGAEKEVRAALIYALRHEPQNEQLLLELACTEKGNCRKTAYWALAEMPGSGAEVFWSDLWKRRPREVLDYLQMSDSVWAADMVADGFLETFRPWAEDQAGEAGAGKKGRKTAVSRESADLMEAYFIALPGKRGGKICECFRLAASLGDCLDRPVEGEKGKWLPSMPLMNGYSRSMTFRNSAPAILCYSLILTGDDELGRTAMELEKTYGDDWFAPALTARLLSSSREECVGWLEGRMWKKSLLGRKIRRDLFPHLTEVLSCTVWDAQMKCYMLKAYRTGPADGQSRKFCRRLEWVADGGGYAGQSADGSAPADSEAGMAMRSMEEYLTELLMSCTDSGLDQVLAHFITPDRPEIQKRLGEYFYKRALISADNRQYLEPLKRCGWTQCAGLAVRFCRGKGRIAYWEIYSYLQRMPGDNAARAEEARQVLELVKKGEIKLPNVSAEQFETLIQELEQG